MDLLYNLLYNKSTTNRSNGAWTSVSLVHTLFIIKSDRLKVGTNKPKL